MSTTSRHAFVEALRQARAFNRGDVLVVTASFRCGDDQCPVEIVRIGIREERGRKVAQPPIFCPRRRGEMTTYIGLERSR